ncbi:MAG TPA: LemA family protein [Longimicrobiales bacterium]|nr:LemA family protein [Longimicrobiales bacterium]
MWPLIVLAAVALGGVLVYNSLVKLRQQAEGAWADIDVQLKRRHDLVPNMVETVKGYADHERETLEAVIAARSRAMSAQGPEERAQAEGMLGGALKSLFALSEAYPQLRASENFQRLQATLAELEDHIQNARRYYNAVVRDYNTRIGQIPANLVAAPFGFREMEFFEVGEGERAVPRVSFGE